MHPSDHTSRRTGSSAGRPRVLFVHNSLARFVAIDLDLLQDFCEVRQWYQSGRRIHLLNLVRAVWEADLIFGWFASWHTFWPVLVGRLLRKPSVVVVGGYDVLPRRHIAYGRSRGRLQAWFSAWTIKNCTHVAAFSMSSKADADALLGDRSRQAQLSYLGVVDPGPGLPNDSRQRMALTVGTVQDVSVDRKGHTVFIEAARLLPDVQFIVVGRLADESASNLASRAPSNVSLSGWLRDSELMAAYRSASVYVQVSVHEGFGMALAEAMLGGVVPVVSAVGSIPEIVGDCGVYVTGTDPKELATAIRTALESSPTTREEGRDRILRRFSLERRSEALQALVRLALVTALNFP